MSFSFADFARGLLPTFKRSKITESIGIIHTRLTSQTLPSYVQADDSQIFQKPKSADVKKRLERIAYHSSRRPASGHSALNLVRYNLENSAKVLTLLDNRAKVLFSETETNLGLTYAKATAMRVLQVIDFYEQYAGLLLNYLLIEETRATDAQAATGRLSKAELGQIEAGFDQFIASSILLEKDIKILEAALKSVPDATITSEGEAVLRATAGDAKVDPMSLRNLSVSANPLWHLAMWKATRQAEQYKAARELRELLQMRIFALQKLQNGESEAHIQREIEIHQDRVTKLNFSIQQMEDSYEL